MTALMNVQPWWVAFTENYTDAITYAAFGFFAFYACLVAVAMLFPGVRAVRLTLPWRSVGAPTNLNTSGSTLLPTPANA